MKPEVEFEVIESDIAMKLEDRTGLGQRFSIELFMKH